MSKRISALIIAVVAISVGGGLAFFKARAKDKLYDQREVANDKFKMRIVAYKEIGVFIPGVYFILQSAPVKSDKWRDILRKRGDEPIPIRPRQMSFVDQNTGYGFISSYYAVTTDAGTTWSIWNGENHIPTQYHTEHNLSPYIEEIDLHPDGTGRMRLYRYFSERDRGPDLFTEDYGLSWHLRR